MRSILTIFLLALLTGGCAGFTPYQPPTTGDMAKLTVTNDTGKGIIVRIFEDAASCSGGGLLPSANQSMMLNAGDSATAVIPATKDLAFTAYISQSEAGACRVLVQFRPEKDRNYVSAFNTAQRGCVLRLSERQQSADGRVQQLPVPSYRQRSFRGEGTMFGCKSEEPSAKGP